MNVLVLVGSTRPESYNLQLADAVVAALPKDAVVERFEQLTALPYYTAADDDAPPAAVSALRESVARADALVVVTPEYNASVPAVVKNAIDWASRPRGAASIAGKPVAVLAATPSPGSAVSARRHLTEILERAQARPLQTTVGIGNAAEAFVGGELVSPEHRAEVEALVAGLTSDLVSTTI